MSPLKQLSRDSPCNWCDQNDPLRVTEVGQQRSQMIRLIIITAGRFLASKNSNCNLEFSVLGH